MTTPLESMFSPQSQQQYSYVPGTGTGVYGWRSDPSADGGMSQGDEYIQYDLNAMGLGDRGYDALSGIYNKDNNSISFSRKGDNKGDFYNDFYNIGPDNKMSFDRSEYGYTGDWTKNNLRGTAAVGLGVLGGMGLNAAGIGGTNIAAAGGGLSGGVGGAVAGAGGQTGMIGGAGNSVAAQAGQMAGATGAGTGATTAAGTTATAGGLGSTLSNIGGRVGTGLVSNMIGSLFSGNQNTNSGTSNLGNLASLVSNNVNNNRLDGLMDQIKQIYSPDGAYAKNLEKELTARDSAAGRGSQYGPRYTELMGKLGDSQARALSGLGSMYNTQAGYTNGMVGAGTRLFDQMGGMQGISGLLQSLFGYGGMTPNSGSNDEFNPADDGWTTDPYAGP